jgi:hypothetical protein
MLPALLTRDLLTIYLGDHLGGATFGAELARRAAASNQETEFGPELAQLASEIEADRRELEQIIEALGRPRDRIKPAAGWLVEKAGRLKPNGRLLSYSPLSRVIELEGLAGGVNAKLALWRALRAVVADEPRLEAHALDRLISRAETQLDRIAALHARASKIAFGSGDAT